MTLCRLLIIIVVAAVTVVAQPFKKLGQHSPPSRGATVLGGKFPPASVFYHHFVRLGKPLLMKNVLVETGYPAYKLWTDKYLREHYAREIVNIERGRKEERGGDSLRLDLAKFLDVYAESNLYMVHTVPDSMKDEILVPHTLQCGGFQDNLQKAVLWFSGGDTTSVLHYDSVDNINCLLDGEKKLVLIDKTYKTMVEEYGWVEDGSYSLLDVDFVDPALYSGISRAPWTQINMEKGDCVYIPYKWYHHIYSPPGRNLAVNFWFSHLWWFNPTDCSNVGNQSKPLSGYKVASPNQQLRSEFLSVFAEQKEVSQKSFAKDCGCKDDQDCIKIFENINKNNDKTLTWAELYGFDMEEIVRQFPQCFNIKNESQELNKEEGNDSGSSSDSKNKSGNTEASVDGVGDDMDEPNQVISDETKAVEPGKDTGSNMEVEDSPGSDVGNNEVDDVTTVKSQDITTDHKLYTEDELKEENLNVDKKTSEQSVGEQVTTGDIMDNDTDKTEQNVVHSEHDEF